MEINDMLCKHIYNIQAKISENQEEIIMQTIQEIGGETFYEITFDRDKVLEALTMYKNKDDYEEVKRGEWEWDERFSDYTCSLCHNWDLTTPNYCPNCGAKMDGGKKDL